MNRLLLHALIVGFACWMASDAIELAGGGRNAIVFYLTAAYHLFAGIGVWGLHLAQAPAGGRLGFAGTALTSVSYLALTGFPLQVLASGLSIAAFMDAHPAYKLLGLAWAVGIVLYSIGIVRARFFPRWAGVAMLLGFAVFSVGGPLAWPLALLNVNTLLLSALVIHLALLGLKADAAAAAVKPSD